MKLSKIFKKKSKPKYEDLGYDMQDLLKIPKKKIIEEENKAIAILKQYIKESYEYHSS